MKHLVKLEVYMLVDAKDRSTAYATIFKNKSRWGTKKVKVLRSKIAYCKPFAQVAIILSKKRVENIKHKEYCE